MSTSTEQLRLDSLGQPGPEVVFHVSADAIRDYARATDDRSAAALEGRAATPAFAIVPVWAAIAPASRSVATDEARKRVVHYEQDMQLHLPIRPGMTLVSRATPVALLPRATGTSLVIRTESRTESGELVNEQWVTEFFRGIEAAESRGDPTADHRLTEALKAAGPLGEITYPIADDQPARYADASGDRFEIHLDDDAARAVGLPGRILHGFCTLAFTARAVCQAAGAEDSTSVRRLAARFSAPVFPGDSLTTRIWRLDDSTFGFEAACAPDRIVIKDGRCEIGRNGA